jgi:predicted aldo/keto reductase-like oxidoreductase
MAYLGAEIPKLGFGLMRLPQQGKEIDIEHTTRMTDLFLEKGFTYFDTAYGYNNGRSEMAAKTVLVDRYPRESFQLATKLPAWNATPRRRPEPCWRPPGADRRRYSTTTFCTTGARSEPRY